MARTVSLTVDSRSQFGARVEPRLLYRGRERDDPGGDWRIAEISMQLQAPPPLLEALPERHFEQALQVGCASGALTAELAARCERIFVLDAFPQEMPVGVWDLIVCTDVLHDLDVEALLRTTHWFSRQLTAGASVIVASHDADAHHLLIHRLACWHAHGELSEGMRVDRFDGDRCDGIRA